MGDEDWVTKIVAQILLLAKPREGIWSNANSCTYPEGQWSEFYWKRCQNIYFDSEAKAKINLVSTKVMFVTEQLWAVKNQWESTSNIVLLKLYIRNIILIKNTISLWLCHWTNELFKDNHTAHSRRKLWCWIE